MYLQYVEGILALEKVRYKQKLVLGCRLGSMLYGFLMTEPVPNRSH